MKDKELLIAESVTKITTAAILPDGVKASPATSMLLIVKMQEILRELYDAGHDAGWADHIQDINVKQN